MGSPERQPGAGFDFDLKFGEARESAFVKAVTSAHVEHKSDQKVRVTGNLFIEFQQGEPSKDSGIAVSEADFWAIEYADECWLVIRRSHLREIARRAYEKGLIKRGGDNHNIGVLIPVEWVLQPWRAVR